MHAEVFGIPEAGEFLKNFKEVCKICGLGSKFKEVVVQTFPKITFEW
jgi:hypothetical protein